MNIDDIARLIGRGGTGSKIAVRSFTNIDTNPVPKKWSHITKVDPENEKKLPLLFPTYLQHTSAISVGGSRNVDSRNSEETFELLDRVDVPVFHEPSAARHVTDKTRDYSEFLAIPVVLNGNATSIVGTLGEGIEYLKEEMILNQIDEKFRWLPETWKYRLSDCTASWLLQSAVFQAYIIQNVDSAAAREANVTEDDLLTPKEAAQRGLAAEKYLESPVIYLEYSGTYGAEEATEILAALDEQITWSRIWYGGGITSRDKATAVLNAGADTVIVGNVFHSIAVEDIELVKQAQENLNHEATLSEITDWVSSEINIEETSSYRYLDTIPDVGLPHQLGIDYLAKTISLYFIVCELRKRRNSEMITNRVLKSKIQSKWEVTDQEVSVPDVLLDLLQNMIYSSIDENSESTLLSHISLGSDFH